MRECRAVKQPLNDAKMLLQRSDKALEALAAADDGVSSVKQVRHSAAFIVGVCLEHIKCPSLLLPSSP